MFLGQVVRVTPYTRAELAELNRDRNFAPLQYSAGLAEIAPVQDISGRSAGNVVVQYQPRPACWYAWSPVVGDQVMVFSGPNPEAWPRERITPGRLNALFDE